MRQIGAYEAKTNFSRLLDEAAAGEVITITKDGAAVAVLGPVSQRPTATPLEAIEALRTFRRLHPVGDVSLLELIDEGRRRCI